MSGKNFVLLMLGFFVFLSFGLALTPTISSFGISPKYTNNSDSTPTLSISASDANGMQFSCDNAAWSTLEAYGASKTDFDIKTGAGCIAGDGNRTVYLRAESTDGNTATASDWIFLDNTVPTITTITPSSSSTVNSNWLAFDVNDAEGVNNATISVKVGGNAATLSGTGCTAFGTNYHCDYNIASIDANGTYNITIDTNDTAGNSATQASISSVIYADNTAPAQVSGLSATAGNTQVALSWSAVSVFDLNQYKVYMSTISGFDTNSETLIATIASGTTTYTKTGLVNGTTYYFKVSALDKSANEGTDSTEASAAAIDTSAPTGSITVPDYSKTSTPTLTLTGSSGTAEMKFSCNDSSWTGAIAFATTYSSFDTTSTTYGCSPSNGSKTIYAQFRKSSGTWSSSYTDSTMFDNNGPSIAFGSPLNNTTVNSTTVSLSCSGMDSNSGIYKYYSKLDTGAWADLGSECSRNYTSVTSGLHTIYVIATDNADNNSSEYSTSFTVSTSSVPDTTPDNSSDATNPKVTWAEPANNSTVSGKVSMKATASDNKGIKKVLFYQGSKLIATVTSKTGNYYIAEWNTEGLDKATYVLSAVAYDTSNNSATDLLTVKVGKAASSNDINSTNLPELSKGLLNAKSRIEGIIARIENYNLALSNQSIEHKTQILNEIKNAEKANSDKNAAGLQNALNRINALIEDWNNDFQMSVEKSEKASIAEKSKTKGLVELAKAFLQDGNVDNAVQLTGNSGIERTIQIIRIKDQNSEYYLAGIVITLKNNEKQKKKFRIVEVVPKSFASSASMLKSSLKFTILKDDPVIAFDVELAAGESAELSYSLDKKFTDKNSALLLASAQNAKAFETPPIVSDKNSPAAGKGTAQQANNGFLLLGLAIAIIILLAGIALFLKSRNDKGGKWGNEGVFDKIPKIEFGKSPGNPTPGRKFKKPDNAEKPTNLHSGMKYNNGLDVWD
ncbi:MAG: Ig-like domain-containing protein [Candidatus Diapherotrites archaeon]|nr:Ig-like domain-containing protein [Candidatus Diapherotrites archaeon]